MKASFTNRLYPEHRGKIHPIKLLLLMKLIVLFICLFSFSSIASTFSQQIDLSVRNEKLVNVIKELRKQSKGYDFAFNAAILEKATPVTIELRSIELIRALEMIFKDQPLDYEIKNKTILIKERPVARGIQKQTGNSTELQQETIRGRVVDSLGNPLAGVTVRVQNKNIATATDSEGKFELNGVSSDDVLSLELIGYQPRRIVADKIDMPIAMAIAFGEIKEVDITISTGIQSIPKERATGSFSQINNELLNRTVSTGVMDRIADVVPGLIFNKGIGAAQGLVIRGQTSISENTSRPLIVIDNFPYEGDINNINPNDVENITILKDAAASSIWGALAGNGVIVITTKQGKLNQKPQVNFNTNYTIGAKPDMFYQPVMSTSDFIDNEMRLFDLNVYRPGELNQYALNYPLTPLVELLIRKRDNPELASEIDDNIAQLRTYDVRNDIEKYLYRNQQNQQYALSLQGGSSNQRYLLSVGYDKNLNSEVGNGLDRITINANNTYGFFNNSLELGTSIFYTDNSRDNNAVESLRYTTFSGGISSTMYPYARLADEHSNPLALTNNIRIPFAEIGMERGLLDWYYRPLDELDHADNTRKTIDYRINTSLKYNINQMFNAQVFYQYGNTTNDQRQHYSTDTYFTRNLINYYTNIATGTNLATRNIPLGGILDTDISSISSHNFRAQLNFDHSIAKLHEMNAIAGYEIRDQRTQGSETRLYGYEDEYATSKLVNYVNLFPTYVLAAYQLRIPNMDVSSDLTDRFVSIYGNASYLYDKRYLLSGSVRFDRSNIFGVETNKKGVPLYSLGVAWNLEKEAFLTPLWIQQLKLRATYGTSGNVNRGISALSTIAYSSSVDPLTGQQYATLRNAPNPNLRWEKINTMNFGVDFGVLDSRISGSFDIYKKWGYDIISTVPYATQSGVQQFTGNYANTEAKGIDINLQTRNIEGRFNWTTDLQMSFTSDKVTKSKLLTTASIVNVIVNSPGEGIYPYEGKPLFALYGYKWAGLNSQTGDPQGYLNGEISMDYTAMQNEVNSDIDKLTYFGTARPRYFGAIRNTFAYRNFSLSANISYRFDYFFRKPSVNYDLVNVGTISHGDYENRWQNPGDDLHTHIPSLPSLTAHSGRSGFYTLSEVLVEKGDNFRLQDIVLSYDINNRSIRSLPVRNIRVYAYANNLGILWKATDTYADPDYYRASFVPVRTFSIGLNADF
ncbi:SusC/RagA family TonB-linked outer membrane protein [Sphingobacterium alkalisoli]|uniref:SusC/RagA family TonB-linked outer membrane protein n=1 Tax=Sphingobacterium alkalisoli TaxID=1874115 RepID=A0A4U0H0K0_9SPHI|nr:SusC/RagA family TonB-linked outer membrane protein [Sphingobacterium alkalisoli]TJY63722.1 SusC/RagA family TonB-linked outer membrane protein [Sphingobacterium alkalisoli]GGH25293.1 SusC/RagA family TonB-linked outer membrane protein [Sphingobacterium alkalisoli]